MNNGMTLQVWQSRRSIVQPTLICGSKTWVCYKRMTKDDVRIKYGTEEGLGVKANNGVEVV